MPPTISAPKTVVLHGGLVAPVESLRLLWQLEDDGYEIRLDKGELVVRPGSRLTAQQRTEIRRRKDSLVALVRYVDEVIA